MKRRSTLQHVGPLPNEARRATVRALYTAGMSLRDIAIRLRITHQSVHGMMQRMGLARRPRGGNTGGHSRHHT